MGKRYRVQDKILLGAAISGDLFFEFVQPLSFQLKKIRGVLPSDYKFTNFTGAVSKMLKTGQLEKVIKNGQPYLRLSGLGQNTLRRDYPIFGLKNKRWDGKWRMVFYDIPEENKKIRDKMKLKLKELGFGMMQDSVYISPYDIAEDLQEFIESQGLKDNIFVGVINQLLSGNKKDLAENIWNLKKLNEKYLELLGEIQKKESLDIIVSKYEDILRRDPCLPKELLPYDWVGDRVSRELKRFFT